jgi:hypothetical protein
VKSTEIRDVCQRAVCKGYSQGHDIKNHVLYGGHWVKKKIPRQARRRTQQQCRLLLFPTSSHSMDSSTAVRTDASKIMLSFHESMIMHDDQLEQLSTTSLCPCTSE